MENLLEVHREDIKMELQDIPDRRVRKDQTPEMEMQDTPCRGDRKDKTHKVEVQQKREL